MASDFKIGGVPVKKGERRKIHLSVSNLYDGTDLSIPVEVIRGKEEGPVLFISAAIHGDEINGTEMVSRMRLAYFLWVATIPFFENTG